MNIKLQTYALGKGYTYRITETESYMSAGTYEVFGLFDREDFDVSEIECCAIKRLLRSIKDLETILIEIREIEDSILLAETIEAVTKLGLKAEIKTRYFCNDGTQGRWYQPIYWEKEIGKFELWIFKNGEWSPYPVTFVSKDDAYDAGSKQTYANEHGAYDPDFDWEVREVTR